MLLLHTAGGPIHGMAFSPDGTLLATAARRSERIHLWNLLDGTLEHFVHHHRVGCLAFTPCKPAFLAWSDPHGEIAVWDRTRSHPQLIDAVWPHNGLSPRLAFSPNGRTLAATGIFRSTADLPFNPPRFGVSLWNWKQGSGFGEPVNCRGGDVFTLAFSPDGSLLAMGGMDKQVHLWDLKGRMRRIATLPQARKLHFLAFCREGRTLASASPDGLVRLWDLENNKCERVLHGQGKSLTGLTCSPDGRMLATSSSDGVVQFWDAETGQLLKAYNWKIGPVWSMAFAPDGQRAAAGGGLGDIVIWDIDT